MPNAKDVGVDTTFIKVFVVGDTGSGKSVFAATFPKPAFLFNFDKSILTYRGLDIDYEDYEQTAAGWVKFEKDFQALKREVRGGTFKYKTLILDSTTTWTDLAMERALSLDPKRSPTGGPMWNVHYGMVKNLIEGFVRQLLELPCNIVVIGHLNKVFNDDGALIGVTPMLTGQLSTKVPSYFDEVYYTQVRTVGGVPKFELLTITKGLLQARSRLSGRDQLLPIAIPNDYEVLVKELTKVR